MEYLRAPGGSRQRGAARIGKQIQYPHGASGRGHLFPDKIPVGSLLREYAGMLEIHGLDVKGQIILILDLPPLRQRMVRPVSAAGIGADIAGVIALPLRSGMGGVPNHLGIGTHQNIFSPPLQALPAGSIQNLIVFPFIGNPKHRPLSFSSS